MKGKIIDLLMMLSFVVLVGLMVIISEALKLSRAHSLILTETVCVVFFLAMVIVKIILDETWAQPKPFKQKRKKALS